MCYRLTRLSNNFINLCDSHPVSHVAKGIATGVCNSVVNYATYAFNNPDDVAIDLALSAICPPAVAVRHLCILAKNAYQHRDDISQATQQFLDDIYDKKYLDSEWLAQHAQGLSQLLCDVFVSPRVGQKIARCSTISPLVNGLRKQKEVVQACILQGVNTAAQKAADSLQTIFKEAADALKTGSPQPAFAGINNNNNGINNNNLNNNNNNASFKTAPTQPRRSERLAKKAGEATKSTTQTNSSNSYMDTP